MSNTATLEPLTIEDTLFGEAEIVGADASPDEMCFCICACIDRITRSQNSGVESAGLSVSK